MVVDLGIERSDTNITTRSRQSARSGRSSKFSKVMLSIFTKKNKKISTQKRQRLTIMQQKDLNGIMIQTSKTKRATL